MGNFNPEYDDKKKDGRIYFFKKIINEEEKNYRKAEAICDTGNTYTESQYDINQQSLEFEIKEKIAKCGLIIKKYGLFCKCKM